MRRDQSHGSWSSLFCVTVLIQPNRLPDPLANVRVDGIAAVPQAFVRKSQKLRPLMFCTICGVALHRAQLVDEGFCVAGIVDTKHDCGRPAAQSRAARDEAPYSIPIAKRIAPSMASVLLKRTA